MKMFFKFSILIFVFMIPFGLFAENLQKPITKISQDYFPTAEHPKYYVIKPNTFSKSQVFSMGEPSTPSCRDNIAKAVCIVNPPQKGEDMDHRPCLDENKGQSKAQYVTAFERLFDQYPAALQKLFCYIPRIFIEKKSFGTAYAQNLTDSKGQFNGAIIGIRQSVLDQNLTLTQWASWKEQLSFGGAKDSYTLTPNLPMVHTSNSKPEVNDFLYFVITHELGHVLDYRFKLNNQINCQITTDPDEDPLCDFTPESWGALSWKNSHEPKVENDFLLRSKLCFYQCEKGFINPQDINNLYSSLWRTNFISTYAASNPWDDFADSFAYYLMSEKLHFDYIIDTTQGMYFDPLFKLHSESFRSKIEFIRKLLESM